MTSAPEETGQRDRDRRDPDGHDRDGWALLDGSLRAVAVEVLRHGPLPRAELSRRVGLSPGSLTRLTRPLLERGLLVEGGPRAGARTGRPSVPLDVRTGRARFAGIAVTSDELVAVVTDLRAGVLDEIAAPLPGRSPDAVVDGVRDVCATLRSRHRALDGIGVGIGGLVTRHRDVVVAPFPGWSAPVGLAGRLTAATGVPVSVDNDVRALAAAEHWFGDGRGLHSFALVTLGDTVGSALVVHDEQVCGAHGLGGATGHLPLVAADHPAAAGGPCELGHPGCAQAVLSTAGLGRAAARRLGTDAALLGRARRGDPAAREVTDAAAAALGVLIGGVVALADPEVVLVSGPGAELVDVARPALDAALDAGPATGHRPSDAAVPVRVAPAGRAGWARGAAVVAIQDHVRGGPPTR